MINNRDLVKSALLLHQQGCFKEALTEYRKILEMFPKLFIVHHYAGLAEFYLGNLESSYDHLINALVLAPDHLEVNLHIAFVLFAQKKFEQAIYYFDKFFERSDKPESIIPHLKEALFNLNSHEIVNIYHEITGRWPPQKLLEQMWNDYSKTNQSEAAKVCLEALTLHYPENVLAWDKLAQSYIESYLYSEAMTIYKEGLKFHPNSARLWHNLGTVFNQKSRLFEALDCFKKVLELSASIQAKSNVINVLRDLGRLDEAIQLSLDNAIKFSPILIPNLFLCIRAHPDYHAQEIFQQFHSISISEVNIIPKQTRAKRANFSKLNIAYISPEFNANSSNPMYQSFLKYHDAEKFNIHYYSLASYKDNMTQKFSQWAYKWRNFSANLPQKAVELIVQDKIDILIELASPGITWPILSKKPAPIQVSGLAFTSTSGQSFFDYRLIDSEIVPMSDVCWNSEKLFVLPSLVCWNPPEFDIKLTKVFREQVYLGFGNDFYKLTDELIDIWTKILNHLPESKLFLKCRQFDDIHAINMLRDKFDFRGIDLRRLSFSGYSNQKRHLEFFHSMDIILDPFPCTGGVSTLEALWSGTPVATISQGTRVSASILNQIRLSELIASNVDDYVDLVVYIAKNKAVRRQYYDELREKILKSNLCNGKKYAFHLEEAFQCMWRTYLQSGNSG